MWEEIPEARETTSQRIQGKSARFSHRARRERLHDTQTLGKVHRGLAAVVENN